MKRQEQLKVISEHLSLAAEALLYAIRNSEDDQELFDEMHKTRQNILKLRTNIREARLALDIVEAHQ